MKTQNQILQDEMRKLITKSCVIIPKIDSEYYSFQKTLLKFFFNVVDVVIDYQTQTITLLNSHTTNMSLDKFYTMNDTVSVTISYTNLEETLQGCLENGIRETTFYQNMLFHYNHVDPESTATAISA
jgi:hypothetical protein